MTKAPPPPEMLGPVEIANTNCAGWAWRCWTCDVNHLNLDEDEARRQARTHQLEHQAGATP